MSWRRDRWRRRSGTWAWRSADRRRCRTARRGQAQLLLGIIRLLLARQRGNLPAVAEEARRLQATGRGPGGGAARPGRGAARAGADQPRQHRVLGGPVRGGRAAPGAGRRAGAPDRAAVSGVHRPGVPGGGRDLPVVRAGGGARQAGDRAGRTARLDRRAGRRHRLHGTRSRAGLAGAAGGGRALGPARRAHPQSRKPSPRRGWRSATSAGCSSWRAAGTPTRWPPSGPPSGWPGASPHRTTLVTRARALLVHALVRLGDTERAEQALAGLGDQDRDRGEMRIATAVLRLAQDDPRAATAALAPVLDGSAPRGLADLAGSALSCWRRSPGTRSATRAPPGGPWSARSTWPSPTARCCCSCCTPRRACSSATPGTAPPTPP